MMGSLRMGMHRDVKAGRRPRNAARMSSGMGLVHVARRSNMSGAWRAMVMVAIVVSIALPRWSGHAWAGGLGGVAQTRSQKDGCPPPPMPTDPTPAHGAQGVPLDTMLSWHGAQGFRLLGGTGSDQPHSFSLVELCTDPVEERLIGSASYNPGLDFDPNGVLYGASSSLRIIDPTDGSTTDVGRIHSSSDSSILMRSIAFHPNGTLYGVATFSGMLHTIDPLTGFATEVGPTPDYVWGIDFAPDGTLYGAEFDLFILDPSTGAAIANLGDLPWPGVVDIDFAPDGFVYGVYYESSTLYRISSSDASATVIGTYESSVWGVASQALGSKGPTASIRTASRPNRPSAPDKGLSARDEQALRGELQRHRAAKRKASSGERSLLAAAAACETSYDVYFDAQSPPTTVIAEGLTDPSCAPVSGGTLDPGSTYYWQVVASNGSDQVRGPIWSFGTAATGDRVLSMPTDLKLDPVALPRCTVHVTVSDAEGIRGARLGIEIEPPLELVPGSVSSADTCTAAWYWAINQAADRLIVSGAGAQPLSAGSCTLIKFDVELPSPDGAACGDEIPLRFVPPPVTRLNDGQVDAQLADGLVRINCPPDGEIVSPADGQIHCNPLEEVCFVAEADDPDGDLPLSYHWDFGGCVTPAGQEYHQNPCVTYCEPGTYTVTLTVTDAIGFADPTPHSITIHVNDWPNGEIVSPTEEPFVIDLGETNEVTLVGAGSDPDGDSVTCHWASGGLVPDSESCEPYTVRVCRGGTYEVSLTVTDSCGLADPSPAVRTIGAIFRWGDANNDEVIGTLDASRILAWDAFLFDEWDEWPCRYARPDFPEAGDVNADDLPGTTDASLVLQYDAGLIGYFPADLDQDEWGPDAPAPGIRQGAGRSTSLPVIALDLAPSCPAEGEQAEVRVLIDDASGLSGFRMALNLHEALEYVPGSATVADTLCAPGFLAVNANDPRRLILSGARAVPVESGSGAILRLQLLAKSALPAKGCQSVHLDLDESLSRLNDGALSAQFLDGQVCPAISLNAPDHGDSLPRRLGKFTWSLSNGVKAKQIEFGRSVKDDGELEGRRRFRVSRRGESWKPKKKDRRKLLKLAHPESGRVFWRMVGKCENQKVLSDIRTFRVDTSRAPRYTIDAAAYYDANGNGVVDRGDRIELVFADSDDATSVPLHALRLPVPGDSLGDGAGLQLSDESLIVILGEAPRLSVDGDFNPNSRNPGDASGLMLAPAFLKSVLGADEPRPDGTPHDIAAAAKAPSLKDDE